MSSIWEEKVKNEIASNVNSFASKAIEKIKKYSKVCVFGAGEHGKNWTSLLLKYGIKVEYICDNNQELHGKQIYDHIICYSPEQMAAMRHEVIMVIAVREYRGILKQLEDMGFSHIYVASINTIGFELNYVYAQDHVWINKLIDQVLDVMNLCGDDLSKQICYETLYKWCVDESSPITYCGGAYFIPELEKSKFEKFVDAGAYIGDTIEEFLKNYKDDFSQVYAFELDSNNFHILKEKVESLEPQMRSKIHLFNKGLWNEEKEIYYKCNHQTSRISEEGEYSAIVASLDELIGEEDISFIKMDIEGAELEALEGCKEHIIKFKPKLAISMYHSPSDFYSIPKYIKELNPEYKIIIRHHSHDESDTVCYAY